MLDEEELVSPSKRKKKQADEISNADSTSTESTSKFEDDESEASTAAMSVVEDDGLPHPRVSYPTPSHNLPSPHPNQFSYETARSTKS